MKKIIAGLIAAVILAVGIGVVYNLNRPDDSEQETLVTEIYANYPIYDTAENLVSRADLIFYGTVENISYEMLAVGEKEDVETEEDKMPYTLYTMHIEKLFRGNADGEEITIKVPGGVFENMEYVLENGPELFKGNTYLFLAESYEDTYPSLLNTTQSAYDINASQPQEDTDGSISLTDILTVLDEADAAE